jgi:hypothetical protein
MMINKIDLREIQQKIEFPDGSSILRLDRLGKKEYSSEQRARNIYRVGGDNAIIWQVRSHFDADGGPFTKMNYVDGTLSAYRWDGAFYDIDTNLGTAVPRSLGK